jgi:hypothetical protein
VELYEAHEIINQSKENSEAHARLVLVDSGAGGTVISDVSLFTVINPPEHAVSIQFGVGPAILVSGVGTVVMRVPSMDSGVTHTVYLKGAYYVPDQPLNILSVRDVLSLPGAVVFESHPGTPSHVRWPSVSGAVYQAMLWRRNLPYIKCWTANVSVHAIRRVSPTGLGYQAIHASFGHMGQAKMQRLVSEGYVDASKLCTESGFACAACEEANAKLDSYPGQQDLAATHVNHTLHTDLLHFPAVTPDGKQYLLLVEDEYTRYAFVALLEKKSDAANHLLRIMKRAYVLQSTRIKNLRSDCGGEFQNTVMRIAKEQLGIADEYVPANCHQSNGLIERLNLSIASVIRVVLRMGRFPVTMWGEAALYAVHLYNLTPHKTLIARKASSSIPHKLYVQDSDERMERLYRQLVPFGIYCSIIQTGEKPQQVKKLDPRSIPGVIVGYGPSTKQYRVMALLPGVQYKVYIVRHILVNAEHFREYVGRTCVVPEVSRFATVHCVDVLSCESVRAVPIPDTVAELPLVAVCATALPTQALIRVSVGVDAPIASEVEPIAVDSNETRSLDEWAIEQTRDEPAISGCRERTRSPNMCDMTVADIEPDHDKLCLEDVMALKMARAKWFRLANQLYVCFLEGSVHVNVMDVRSQTKSEICAGQDFERVILELWHVQDVELWTVDLDNPTFKVAMQGPHRDK